MGKIEPDLNPIFLDMKDKAVLVVGGGKVAVRKVRRLLEKGACVTVVAPGPEPEMKRLASEESVMLAERSYSGEDLKEQWLVFACTDDSEVNQAVFADAQRQHVWCNVVDQPDLCSFQVPAIISQGLLQIAISTGGASPGLARRLRQYLEGEFGPLYKDLLEVLRDIRLRLKEVYPDDQPRRQAILESLLDSPELETFIRDGDAESLAQELETWKSRSLE